VQRVAGTRRVRVKYAPRVYTAEEMLAESKVTAEQNRRTLAELLLIEQERKRVTVKKHRFEGPTVTYRSGPNPRDPKSTRTTVTFSSPAVWPVGYTESNRDKAVCKHSDSRTRRRARGKPIHVR
jgi:hypothetical protein